MHLNVLNLCPPQGWIYIDTCGYFIKFEATNLIWKAKKNLAYFAAFKDFGG